MLRLIGLAVSIGLADSLNPSTVGPALFLAAGERPLRGVVHFTAAIFAVFLLGGALITLGPGQAVLALIPRPGPTVRYIAETVAGVLMLIAAVVLWRRREQLGHHEAQDNGPPKHRSPGRLGATIAVVELPTAFPYFAVIVAIVGSGFGIGGQAVLLVLYNVCFVLPLIVIAITLRVAGPRATEVLGRVRAWLHEHWPVLVAVVALVAEGLVTLLENRLITWRPQTVADVSL